MNMLRMLVFVKLSSVVSSVRFVVGCLLCFVSIVKVVERIVLFM